MESWRLHHSLLFRLLTKVMVPHRTLFNLQNDFTLFLLTKYHALNKFLKGLITCRGYVFLLSENYVTEITSIFSQ